MDAPKISIKHAILKKIPLNSIKWQGWKSKGLQVAMRVDFAITEIASLDGPD
jgi:hypothetical protein